MEYLDNTKKLTLGAALMLLLTTLIRTDLYSQNSLGSADDAARIALTVYVPDQGDALNGSVKQTLSDRLNQIATKNGISGNTPNQRFILTASVAELSKDITASTPPVYVYNLEVTLYIGDGVEGTKFATHSVELKGTGNSAQKAYLSALKNLKSGSSEYQEFIELGKTRIIEYYNSQCDFILKTAQGRAARKEYDDALLGLLAVPEVCKECFEKCTELTVDVFKQKQENECAQNLQEARVEKTNNNWEGAATLLAGILPDVSCYADAMVLMKDIEDHRCSEALGKAKGAWASFDADNAGRWLAQVSADSKCSVEADALGQEIRKKLKDEEDRDWDFKLMEQKDETAIRKATIAAARDVGVAYGNNQPQNITYNVRGWW
jgi:hypothetical protein